MQVQSSDIILEKRTCSYQKLPGDYIIYSIEFTKENFENLHCYRLSRRVSVSGLIGDLICMADYLMEYLDKLTRNEKSGNNYQNERVNLFTIFRLKEADYKYLSSFSSID